MSGVKEEILLSYNVGKNSFAFLLETDGLVLTEQNGQFVLVNPETEQQVGKLSEIIVFDSAGQIVRGNMTAQTVKDGQIYGVTVSVDEEFLANATYPVAIDPTVSCTVEQFDVAYSEIKYIEDVGVYSTPDAWNFSFEQMHFIGKSTHGNYYGAVLYRFPFLYDLGFLDSNQVFLTSLSVRCWMGNTSSITVHTKEFTENWDDLVRICDEELYSSATGGSADQYFKTYTISNNGEVTLDVTEITKAWIDYIVNPNAAGAVNPEFGLSLYSTDTTKQIQINAVDYIAYNDTLATRVTIEYMPSTSYSPYYYINNKYNSNFLSAGYTDQYVIDFVNGTTSELGENAKWSIRPYAANQYTISTFFSDGHLLLNQSGGLTVTEDISPSCLWSLEYYGEEDAVLRNVAEDSVALCVDSQGFLVTAALSDQESIWESGNLPGSAFLWRIIAGDEYNEFQLPSDTFEVYANYSLNIKDYISDYAKTNNYKLATAGDLIVESFEGAVVPIDSSGEITPTQMYISVSAIIRHLPTDQSSTFTFVVRPICPGTYVIQNKSSSLFVDVEDNMMEEGMNILQTNFLGSDFQKWCFSMTEDGYYTIAVEGNGSFGYCLSVSNNQSNNGAILTLDRWLSSDSIEDGTKWKIYPTASGAYKLISKCGEEYDRAMSVTSTTTPYVRQYTYTGDEDFTDEWYIMKYAIHINPWYDNAWLEQYPNAVEEIENYLQIAQDVYKDAFEVWISYGVPTNFISVSDQCSAAADQPCTCTIFCDNHHKNKVKIFDTLPTSSASTAPITATVAFIGHYVCENGDNGCEDAMLLGVTRKAVSKILVLPHDNVQNIAGTTVHEIGHLMGAPDHYYMEGQNTTASKNMEYGCVGFFDDECLYGLLQIEYIFCDGCIYEMKQYIFEHIW